MINILAFIVGAVTAPLLPKTLLFPPSSLFAVAAGFLFTGCAIGRWVPKLRRLKQYTFLIFSLLAGLAVAAAGVQRHVEASLDEKWHGQNISLRGQVVEVVRQSEDFSRFHFRIQDVEPQPLKHPLRRRLVRLSWYYGGTPAPGEDWSLQVRLKRPRGFVNPRGFDYAAWLLTQDLVATGYVRSGERLSPKKARVFSLLHWREQLAGRVLGSKPASTPFFQALLLGDKSGISSDQWRVLKRTGTIHLMAISGLHVGLVAGIGFFLGRLLARALALFAAAGRWVAPGRWLPPLLSSILAALYSGLAGFSIPTQRAMLLILLANLAIWMGLRVGPWRLLASVCVLVLLTAPLAPTQSGFWLSFLAVLVLVAGFSGKRPSRSPLHALVKAQLLLAVGLLAPLLALGQAVSLVGPLANLVAVPVVSLIVVPGLLVSAALGLASPLLAGKLTVLLDRIFQWLWQLLTVLSDLSSMQWWPAFPTTTLLVLMIAGGTLLLLVPRGLGLKGPGAVLLVLALFAPREPPPPLKLVAMEVGQGLAVWLQVGRYNLLYDTGPSFGDRFDAGSRIVAPFLRSQGVRHLNTIIVSHGDNDHRGGLEGILRSLPHDQFLAGDRKTTEAFPAARRCSMGRFWRWQNSAFHLLWPPEGSPYTGNNSSCVLLVEWHEHRILLLGDVEAKVEARLIETGALPPKVDLVIAAHHGSATSSSTTLVNHLRPQAVIFSAGYQNRYGHPHPEVVKRYRRVGARVYTTGDSGAISFVWQRPEAQPRVEAAREAIDRAWY